MKSIFAAAILFVILAGNAVAGVMAQCTDDAARFCPNVKPKRLYACLREHAAKLSLGCADVMGQGNGPSGEVCLGDVRKLCNSRKINKTTSKCLERHFDQLSSGCQSYFYSLGWVR